MVVGYDGTPPARHALEQAVDLLQYREGALEVVYVAHLPESVALSPEGLAEVQQGLDQQARVLAEEVYHRLVGEDHPWHFQRRDGAVAAELIAVADDVHRRYADAAEIVIVMGASGQHHHHVAGSVGSSVVRSRTFPALVVPYKGSDVLRITATGKFEQTRDHDRDRVSNSSLRSTDSTRGGEGTALRN
jgi:nucleotide-binding universal stress UspA family protein